MGVENFKRNERLEEVFNRVAAIFDSIGPKYFSYFGEKLIENSRVNVGATLLFNPVKLTQGSDSNCAFVPVEFDPPIFG